MDATVPGLEKVTAIIIQRRRATDELLLIRHPYAGFQLPAGTVEPGEAPADAVVREAREETGLETEIAAYLGALDERRGGDWRVLVDDTPVYVRPDARSACWAKLRRGLGVTARRSHGDWVQISYMERDTLDADAPVSYQLTGWASRRFVAAAQTRHFYHLRPIHADSPRTWTVHSDHHDFQLFWTPLNQRPRLVDPQEAWLAYVNSTLGGTA